MHAINAFITGHVGVAWIVLAAAFFVLAKCADAFVDASVAIAHRLHIPKLVVGIVLVSLATTAPELSVSFISALRGQPEIAMGNAVGSVICNGGLALALCGLLAARPIRIIPHVLHTAGTFLSVVAVLAFVFVLPDRTLGRIEGLVLLLLFGGYTALLYWQHRTGRFREDVDIPDEEHVAHYSVLKLVTVFALSLTGIIVASEFIVTCATTIAVWVGIPTGVIAMVMVALGTSIPEVASCATAARKGEGALAVGNILGANIMNICWVAGASAAANPLTLTRRELLFMFPAMFVMVGAKLGLLWRNKRLSRRKGYVLLAIYVLYLASFFVVFRPSIPSA
jgi:cation:H+ antiporter